MKRTRYIAIVAAVLAALTLASCQDFFTSSFASWAQRDPSVPSGLTADQAMSIADQAVANRDTALAQALLPQMVGFLTGTPSDEIIGAAVDTAVLASGIDEAFGEALTTLGTAFIESGGVLTLEQKTALTAILSSVSVAADGLAVFEYIDLMPIADLENAGITAADCAMGAGALILAQAALEGISISDLLNGTYPTGGTTPDYLTPAENLLTTGGSLSGGGDIYTLIDGMF